MKCPIAKRITSLSLIFLIGLFVSACSSPGTAQEAQSSGERTPQGDEETVSEQRIRKLQEWRERKQRQ